MVVRAGVGEPQQDDAGEQRHVLRERPAVVDGQRRHVPGGGRGVADDRPCLQRTEERARAEQRREAERRVEDARERQRGGAGVARQAATREQRENARFVRQHGADQRRLQPEEGERPAQQPFERSSEHDAEIECRRRRRHHEPFGKRGRCAAEESIGGVGHGRVAPLEQAQRVAAEDALRQELGDARARAHRPQGHREPERLAETERRPVRRQHLMVADARAAAELEDAARQRRLFEKANDALGELEDVDRLDALAAATRQGNDGQARADAIDDALDARFSQGVCPARRARLGHEVERQHRLGELPGRSRAVPRLDDAMAAGAQRMDDRLADAAARAADEDLHRRPSGRFVATRSLRRRPPAAATAVARPSCGDARTNGSPLPRGGARRAAPRERRAPPGRRRGRPAQARRRRA
jgi:hypothetical protein